MKRRALKTMLFSIIVFTQFLLVMVDVKGITGVDDLTKNCKYSSEITRVNKTNSVEPLIWISPDGSLPTMFNETERSRHPFSVELKYQTDEVLSSRMVYVMVDSSIYGSIEDSLNQHVIDVESSGFSVSVYSGTWGTSEETRTFLQQEFSKNLTGCLLVGDIPEAWYEMDYWGHEEFPIDLYYMDLDGVWTDSDGDGIYDGHDGDVEPEIWVGRLKASTLSGDEESMLNNYFSKNHRYRTGTLSVPQCALVYVDDDWVYWADEDNNALGQIYDQTVLVKHRTVTNAKDYKNRLRRGYEWVHLRCHGCSRGHVFSVPEGSGGWVYSSDYRSIDPPVLFYQLFVCSGARYVESNYLGGSCIFTDTGGLLAIGSAKTGSMLHFSNFYGALAEGDNIGDAFREWFMEYGESSRAWFYGLTILGDPLLKPLMSPPDHDLMILEIEKPPYLEPEASVFINTTVFNMGTNDEANITVQMLVDGSVVNSTIINSLERGTSTTVSCTWTPDAVGNYIVTYYVVPVPGENLSCNNIVSETVSVQIFPEIIIVADDDANSMIRGTSVQEFECALKVGGYDYSVWYESSMGNPPLDFLSRFSLVIWTCGDYWSGAVDPTDATTLEAYLAQGGNIILEGEDIGYDHHDDRFMVNVAHAIFETDYTGAPGLTVTNHTHPVTRDLPTTITWVTYPPYDDGVSPTNGGFEVIRYTETEWTAVTVFEGTSLGYVVYYAFPLYCLKQSIRDTLVINSIERDVAIVDVTVSPTVVTAGETVLIEVNVENQGTITETFDVAVYHDDVLIETSTVTNLAPYTSSRVFFYWDTSGVAGIVYEIKAVASTVPHEIDIENNIFVDGTVTVYPPIDIYTQRGGRGEGAWADAYAPQEEVIIFASVTHKGDPVQNKPVAFEVGDPTGYVWLFRSNSTDENGIATVSFRIPSSPVFGTWNATATGDIAGQTFNDTVTFKVGWLVEIVKVETVDNCGSPKTNFVKGEHIYFNVTVQNIAFTSKEVTITIVVYDECGVPIGLVTLQDWVIGPGRTEIFIISLQIPKWAYIGKATVYANAYTSLPQEGGTPYCPETSTIFIITLS